VVGSDVDQVQLIVIADVAGTDPQHCRGGGGVVGDDQAEGGTVLEIHGVYA
jgi:hypothetical protein